MLFKNGFNAEQQDLVCNSLYWKVNINRVVYITVEQVAFSINFQFSVFDILIFFPLPTHHQCIFVDTENLQNMDAFYITAFIILYFH